MTNIRDFDAVIKNPKKDHKNEKYIKIAYLGHVFEKYFEKSVKHVSKPPYI